MCKFIQIFHYHQKITNFSAKNIEKPAYVLKHFSKLKVLKIYYSKKIASCVWITYFFAIFAVANQ